jgi:hypothetical protein
MSDNQNNQSTPTDLKVDAPNAERIIVQPVPSYQDRLVEKVADQVLSNVSSVALGVVLCVTGAVLAAKWIGVPEAVKTFLENQRKNIAAIDNLAEGLKDLLTSHKEHGESIKELRADVKEVREDVQELKIDINKRPSS